MKLRGLAKRPKRSATKPRKKSVRKRPPRRTGKGLATKVGIVAQPLAGVSAKGDAGELTHVPKPHRISFPAERYDSTPQDMAASQRRVSAAVLSNLGDVVEPPVVPVASNSAGGVGASISAADGSAVGVGTATGISEVAPPDPRFLHQQMLRRIEALESVIADLPAGIGHNRPPESIDPVPFAEDDLRAVTAAIAVLKNQPSAPTMPSTAARRAASTLKIIGERLWDYLARTGAYVVKQGDTFVSEAAKSAGAEFGKRFVQLQYWLILAGSLMAAASAVSSWLASHGVLN